MNKFLILFLLMYFGQALSQVTRNDTIRVEKHPTDSVSTVAEKDDIQILADINSANNATEKPQYNPTRAGLYSAVLPGLGQYYNKKYWKIPVVWGAVGAGVGVVLWNQKQYSRYRNAFVASLNGQPHEFSDIAGATDEALGRSQDRAKRQRDYAIAITGLVYILNIVDAIVDAHLYEQRHDPELTLQPTILRDDFGLNQTKTGLTLTYKF